MKKISKISIFVILLILVFFIAYGIVTVMKKTTYSSATKNPTYRSTLSEHTINNLWVGTLDLAWKEFEEQLGVTRIQIEGDNIPKIASDLNASTFTKEMLNENDYEISVENELNSQKINVTFNKELTFLETFNNFNDLYRDKTFGVGNKYIKYFGINSATPEYIYRNVEILFYNRTKSEESFAVKLKTQEGDEIILYRTDDEKSFDEYYEDIQSKTQSYYEDIREFTDNDMLLIPYVKVNGIINYDELLGRTIKDTGRYFSEVRQTVNFCLNEKGCSLTSNATLVGTTMGISGSRTFDFTDTFIIFMKEKNVEQPYFALKVDNDDILEPLEEEYKGPAILDYSKLKTEYSEFDTSTIQPGEYKFYEDEKYEYYYPTQKTEFVFVSKYPYGMLDMTAEEALKEGIVTIDIFDKYGIEYIKKEK
ncbi:MAG: hypothetical protein K1W33_08890 [Clostridia bacterium]